MFFCVCCYASLCIVLRVVNSCLFRFPRHQLDSHRTWEPPKLTEFPRGLRLKALSESTCSVHELSLKSMTDGLLHRFSFGEKLLLSLILGSVETFSTPLSSSVNHFAYHDLWSCLPLLTSFQNSQNFSGSGNGLSNVITVDF